MSGANRPCRSPAGSSGGRPGLERDGSEAHRLALDGHGAAEAAVDDPVDEGTADYPALDVLRDRVFGAGGEGAVEAAGRKQPGRRLLPLLLPLLGLLRLGGGRTA